MSRGDKSNPLGWSEGIVRVAVMLAIVALLILRPPSAIAHSEGESLFEGAEILLVPYTMSSPTIDGVVGSTEYNDLGRWTEEGEGLQVSLAHNDSALFIGVQQPGVGWVGLALVGDVEIGANVVIMVMNGSAAIARDSFAAEVTDEMASEPDESLGGTFDVIAVGATSSSDGTAYEVAIPLSSEDPRDQQWEPGTLYPFAIAFNETASEFPSELAEGDLHFLRAYVARATDDLNEIRDMFMAGPSPVPPLMAMVVFSTGFGALMWRYLSPRRLEES